MEARDCPALFVWTGKYGTQFSTYTPEGPGGNWLAGSDWYSLTVPLAPPGSLDDVYYKADYVQGDANSTWGGGLTTVHSLHVIKSSSGGAYPGTIQLGNTMLLNGLELRTGNLSQGPTTTLTITRDNPGTNSLWDGGVLNSGPFEATVIFSATSATIDPGGATLVHGSDIKAANNAAVTILDGTVQTARDVTWMVVSGASLQAGGVNLLVSLAGTLKPIAVSGDATVRLTGTYSTRALLVESGTALILGQGKTTTFARQHANSAVTVYPPNGMVANGQPPRLVVENGTTLDGLGGDVLVAKGYLSTKAVPGVAKQPDAVIKCGSLRIGTAAEVRISDVAYNPPQPGGGADPVHKWAKLKVDGSVLWYGGTYRPDCDPLNDGNADIWESTGIFAINGPAVVIAPVSANIQAKNDYLVMVAGGGFISLVGERFTILPPTPEQNAGLPLVWDWKGGTAYNAAGNMAKNSWRIKKQ